MKNISKPMVRPSSGVQFVKTQNDLDLIVDGSNVGNLYGSTISSNTYYAQQHCLVPNLRTAVFQR